MLRIKRKVTYIVHNTSIYILKVTNRKDAGLVNEKDSILKTEDVQN